MLWLYLNKASMLFVFAIKHEDWNEVDETFTVVFELGECGNETLYFFAVTIHLLIAELPQLWTDGSLHPLRRSKEIVSNKVKEKTVIMLYTQISKEIGHLANLSNSSSDQKSVTFFPKKKTEFVYFKKLGLDASY